MSASSLLYTEDAVSRLYLAAESLRWLAQGLPEANGGLASILATIAATVQSCGETLDDAVPPASPRGGHDARA